MRFFSVFMMVAMTVLLACAPGWGKAPYLSDEALQKEIRLGIEQILDLWRDGRYEDLFERTAMSGKQTREQFARTMAEAPLRPACCWEKIQDLSVSVKGDSAATFRAKLGFEGGGGTEFKTRGFKLVKEDGVWRMSQSDLLSLAEGKPKKAAKKVQKRE